jgi:DNA-binding winged helix-turn-helix (wHTH) protein/Tol biopolymer transport system component
MTRSADLFKQQTRLAVVSYAVRDTPVPDSEVNQVIRFAAFEVDLRAGELRKNGLRIRLQEQPFQILLALAEKPGEVITREELRARLWQADTFVDFDHGLNAAIRRLRDALGDSAESPRFVETVARRGYRFLVSVEKLGANRSTSASVLVRENAVPPEQVSAPAGTQPDTLDTERTPASGEQRRWILMLAAAAVAVLAVGVLWRFKRGSPDRSQWVQLTKLPDSVTQPALSPDGGMLAFIRGNSTLAGPGQIYVKILPGGEPVQLTHDNVLKMSPTFSPDGARIAYTAVDPQFHWDTWVVPTLGGEPQPLLRNASGLLWTGPQQVLFSEIKMGGLHMGIVGAEESRIGARDVYLPEDEPAMAHRSYLSPDGKWVLLVEMDQDHLWLPCRLAPINGSTPGRHVGPPEGGCTFAAWSHDGRWMYFTTNPGGINHIWRQRFPDGQPEQITSGPTEEEGIAIAPDGRSLVTSVALRSTSLWVHDAKGERQISLEGNGANPKFTPDGKKLCYLIVKEAPNQFPLYRDPGELRIADLESGRSEPVVRDFPVLDYDISADGQQVVMWTRDQQLWVARFDRGSPPVQVLNAEGGHPRFGLGGDILFRHLKGTSTFVYRVHADGSGLQKALEEPVFTLNAVSPDGGWVTGWAPLSGNGRLAWQAFPLNGGPSIPVGMTFDLSLSWSFDGRSSFISHVFGGQTFIVPLAPGEALPRIPAGGFPSDDDIAHLPGARRIDAEGVVPGPSANVYAFYHNTIQRNLYRIPIR